MAASAAGRAMECREAMTVHFIGAGPGAPDLLTIRAQRLIASCPVCLYAGALVPPEVVAQAPDGARVIDTQHLDLEQIIAELCAAHGRGEDVARLHSGDLGRRGRPPWRARDDLLAGCPAQDPPHGADPGRSGGGRGGVPRQPPVFAAARARQRARRSRSEPMTHPLRSRASRRSRWISAATSPTRPETRISSSVPTYAPQ